MFSFEFQCIGWVGAGEDFRQCGAILSGRCYLAVAKGTGHLYACRACGQEYKIREDGAHPIVDEPESKEPQTFVDAVGKPFVLSNWEPPPPPFNWKGESDVRGETPK